MTLQESKLLKTIVWKVEKEKIEYVLNQSEHINTLFSDLSKVSEKL